MVFVKKKGLKFPRQLKFSSVVYCRSFPRQLIAAGSIIRQLTAERHFRLLHVFFNQTKCVNINFLQLQLEIYQKIVFKFSCDFQKLMIECNVLMLPFFAIYICKHRSIILGVITFQNAAPQGAQNQGWINVKQSFSLSTMMSHVNIGQNEVNLKKANICLKQSSTWRKKINKQ